MLLDSNTLLLVKYLLASDLQIQPRDMTGFNLSVYFFTWQPIPDSESTERTYSVFSLRSPLRRPNDMEAPLSSIQRWRRAANGSIHFSSI